MSQERRFGTTFAEKSKHFNDAEDWDQLLKLSLERQKTHPTNSDGYFDAGMAYANTNQFDLAIASFNRSTQLNPSCAASCGHWIEYTKKKRDGLNPTVKK